MVAYPLVGMQTNYRILGNFHKNGDFNNFAENIFANNPRRQHRRCGMAILLRNLILRLSKIRDSKYVVCVGVVRVYERSNNVLIFL